MIVPPVGGLGSGLSVSAAEGLAQGGQAGAGATGGSAATGFGGELTEAISSLEQTQNSGSAASQALASGSVSDPETAVVTVEDAQLAMELASQIRNKATEAATSIFNTQV